MKLFFGAKPGRFCLRSTIWIAASHRRESDASVLAVNKYRQASGAKSVEGSRAFCALGQRSTNAQSAPARFVRAKADNGELDVYALCSTAVSFRVTQVFDIVRGVHALIPKAIFAPELRREMMMV
jgi:hypothetical protein